MPRPGRAGGARAPRRPWCMGGTPRRRSPGRRGWPRALRGVRARVRACAGVMQRPVRRGRRQAVQRCAQRARAAPTAAGPQRQQRHVRRLRHGPLRKLLGCAARGGGGGGGSGGARARGCSSTAGSRGATTDESNPLRASGARARPRPHGAPRPRACLHIQVWPPRRHELGGGRGRHFPHGPRRQLGALARRRGAAGQGRARGAGTRRAPAGAKGAASVHKAMRRRRLARRTQTRTTPGTRRRRRPSRGRRCRSTRRRRPRSSS